MKRELTFAFPGDLNTKTGGYAYDRRVIAGLADLGWTLQPLSLGAGFPFPSGEVKAEAERLLSALPNDALVLIDGLAFGVLDAWAEREAERLKIVALVHHPLALETGLEERQQKRLLLSERHALSQARAVIVTSPATSRELVAQYGVDADRLTVIRPGTDPAPASKRNGNPQHIVSVGTLTPRKGHDILLSALKLVEDLPWTASIAGSRDLDPRTAASLEQQIRELGLNHRVFLIGECDDVRQFLANADLFALASRYEGYGMVFAEALAHGLPIVACRAGAVPEVVPDTAGILVPVNNIQAFSQALRRLLTDPAERDGRAKAARLAGSALPGWDEQSRKMSRALEALL